MIDLATIKLALGITGTAKDDLLTELEAAAVAYAQLMTGWYLGPPAETTEFIPGSGYRGVYLRQPALLMDAGDPPEPYPFSVSESDYPGGTAVEIAVDGYTLRGQRLLRAGGDMWIGQDGEVAVTYTRGFAPGTEPAEIRGAVLWLVGLAWNTLGKGGLQSESISSYSYTLGDFGDLSTMPFHIRGALQPKRIRV